VTGGRALALGTAGLVLGAALVSIVLFALPRWRATPAVDATLGAPVEPPDPGRRIKARLFYVAPDGAHLVGVDRDVPYGEDTLAQARQILESQLAPVAEPLVSAVPPGTTVRALFVSERGEAFVDFSSEIVSAHPGGALDELLTIYTVVDALTTNLPAVHSVRVLVDGKEVDTLVGHVDLRRPFSKDLTWVQ
jgi:spore germination protein GerM